MLAAYAGHAAAALDLLIALEETRREAARASALLSLAHELADVLWCVMTLADAYDVDLERAFIDTMADLTEHLTRDPRE